MHHQRTINLVVPIMGLLFVVLTVSTGIAWAEEADSLGVELAIIGRGVVAHQAVGAGTRFPADVGKLYCLTKIVNIKSPTQIYHIWFYGEKERARVRLNVNPPSWRTYSSKIIQPHEIGEWRVDVIGPNGERLVSVPFEIGR